jgi:phosphatidylglycerol lysyltransferase
MVRAALTLLPLAVFGLALLALHRWGGELHLAQVLAAFRAIGPGQVAAAVVFAAVSYLLLTVTEKAALIYARVQLPWLRCALTSFVASALGNSLGAGALSGAAVRYRMYSSLGIRATDIVRASVFCTATLALGIAMLAGATLLTHANEAAVALHASSTASAILGFVLLCGPAVYLVRAAVPQRTWNWRGWQFEWPAPNLAAAQLVLGAGDLLAACACAYVLLPVSAETGFLPFATLFMLAVIASVLSGVPGGIGVFESLMVLLLPDVPPQQLLASLLAYRIVYYLVPFLVALTFLLAHETTRQRDRLAQALRWARRALDPVAPQALSLLVFGAGFLLLVSGATPGIDARLALLERALPLPMLELSHLAASAIGVMLLVLARGLLLRLDAARHLTLWLLGMGVAASLLKGLDFEEALLLIAVMLPLWLTRAQFYRRASLLAERLSPAWMVSAAVAVLASIWVGLLAYRHVPYANELWWQFALDGNAPRMLRASLVAVLLLGAVSLARLLGPARFVPQRPGAAEFDRVLPIVAEASESSSRLALLGDKSFLFSESGKAFLMYAVNGGSWIAMGDPVGPASESEELVWRFRELADRAGARCVFYQVGPDRLSEYIDAGLALSKLGEEARVELAGFSLEGSGRADLRQSHRRGVRDGLTFRIVPPEEVLALLPTLRRVSDEWLQAKAAVEKGFSLGRFDDEYLRRFPVAVVEQRGEVVAFANVWETGPREEVSIDLMRHAKNAPRSTMDFLFCELMLWGREQGYRWFNLGMAPLSGLEARRLAPAWHKIGRFVYRHGEDFYNFTGLRQYKQKFAPEWRPRYLAAPGGFSLPGVLLDVATLISGRTGLTPGVLRARTSRAQQGASTTEVPV